MSDGNRIAAGTLGLAAAFLLVFAVGLWAGETDSRYGNPQQYANENAYTDAKGEAAILDAPLFVGPRSYQDICANPQSHDDADLCQQWRAASAGRDTARFAAWQLFLSVIGVGGLALTVYLSNKATNAATEATKAAIRSADASEHSLRELERPHVFASIPEAGIQVDGRRLRPNEKRFRCDFTNYGRMPARMLQVRWEARYVRINGGLPEPLSPNEGGRTIPSGNMIAADTNKPYWEHENPAVLYDLVRMFEEDWWFKEEVVFLSGWFRYANTSDTRRWLVGFNFLYDPIGNRYVSSGGPEHNYVREE